MWSSQQLAPHPKKNGPEFGPENGPNLGPQTWLSLTAAVCATEQQRQHFTVQRGIKWQAKHTVGLELGLATCSVALMPGTNKCNSTYGPFVLLDTSCWTKSGSKLRTRFWAAPRPTWSIFWTQIWANM